MTIKLLSIQLIAALTCFPCHAQSWKPVDGNVVSDGVHGFATWNNKLVLGGSFSNPCERVAVWDSLSYACLDSGVGIVGRAAIEYGGDLIVSGDFWNVKQPCTGCNGIAKWNGSQWVPLGTGFNNDVLALTIWNGDLVAGGAFNKADGSTCQSVARWNGSSWTAIGGLTNAFNGQVRALAVYNNELWAGGDFTAVSGCNGCSRIAKWNGNSWIAPGTPNVPDTVRALYADTVQNRLYMGGHFSEAAGDTNANGIAVFDGNNWSPLGTGVSGKGSYVRAITKYNGDIIIGGYFSHVNGTVNAKRVARWNPNTSTWSAIGEGLKSGYVRALKEYKGELYAGGSFNISGLDTVNYIAKWYETPTATNRMSLEPAEFSIYPNPFRETAVLEIRGRENDLSMLYVQLQDIFGRIVKADIRHTSSGFLIHKGDLPQGIYSCRISKDNTVIGVKKVIVQ